MTHTEKNAKERREDIAIVGMECQFPGADNAKAYWDLLYQNQSAVKEVGEDRWSNEFYQKENTDPTKMTTKWAGMLNWFDKFDPAFFGISPHEAERIDPQQKILLMIAYGAFEDAGIPMSKINKSNTGVFIGVGNSDFSRIATNDKQLVNAYTGGGIAFCMVANRLSYIFDLKGPSLAIDTACSSSIVAINQACESLWMGTSDMALAGGTSLNIWPDTSIILSNAEMLSKDGQCKTFDDDANGFVKGEGAGIVVLKRMSDAVKDGSRILGVIKGISINHNGKSNGLTAPSRFQQRSLIQHALTDANIAPEDISFIETHGTGTSLGDPIEMNALKDVFMKNRAEDNLCYLGAVKTNIGHLEASAGMAGVIKTLLAIKHKTIPANLNLNKVNKYLNIDKTSFELPAENIKWEPKNGKRIAGVSSFGFGGSNGHMIIEEYAQETINQYEKPCNFHLLNLSAKNKSSLQQLAENYKSFIVENDGFTLKDICRNAQTNRSHFNYRCSILAKNKLDMIGKLKEISLGNVKPKLSRKKIAFLFTGQGSQYLDMAGELYFSNETFNKYINQSIKILTPLMDIPILPLIVSKENDESLINQTKYTQPIIFAIEYALAKTLEFIGVKPNIVIGHSLGEIVAACIAGVFTLEDGLKIAVKRGLLMQETSEEGRMVNVFAEKEVVENYLNAFEKLSIAANNGYSSHVVSGHSQEMEIFKNRLEEDQIKYRILPVNRAFHSYMMDPILEDFYNEVAQIELQPPLIPIISNLNGAFSGDRFVSPEYWKQHLRLATNFLHGIESLSKMNCDIMVEIGPNPILIDLIQRSAIEENAKEITYVSTLVKGKNSFQQFLKAVGALYDEGLDINWSAFNQGNTSSFVDLPKYPFQLESYWLPEYDEIIKNNRPNSNNVESRIIPINGNNEQRQNKVEVLKEEENKVNIKSVVLTLLNNILIEPITDFEDSKNVQLVDLGLESIMVFNLRAQLKKHIPGLQDIPIALFSAFSLADMVAYIEEKISKQSINIITENVNEEVEATCERLIVDWSKTFKKDHPERIDQKLVHKHVLENVLLAKVEKICEDTFLLEMTQDTNHPFFYEHYLDHVPAMYIMEAITQAARAIPHLHYDIGYGVFFIINEMESRFDEFAELNVPVFFRIDVEDKTYKNGKLDCGTLNCTIYQGTKKIGVVKGTGQFFDKNVYHELRKNKMRQTLKLNIA